MIRTHGAAALVVAALTVFGSLSGCTPAGSPAAGDRTGRAESTAPVLVIPPAQSRTTPAPPASTSSPNGGIRTRRADLPTATAVVQPVRLQLERIGIDLPVVAVGVAADGQMELPPDPANVGWYRFGPGTGDTRGSIVLGGHVDSKEYGVGPLARLRTVRPGDVATLRSGDGSIRSYRIRTVEDIAKSKLVLERIFDRDGAPLLRIITCGGPYDRDGGGYRDNLVVTAVPT